MRDVPESRHRRVHLVGAVVFTAFFVVFSAGAVVTAHTVTYTPFQWTIIGFLVISAGLSAAGEIWEVQRGRRQRDDR